MRASAKENEQIATNKPDETKQNEAKPDGETKTHNVFDKTVDQQSGYAIGRKDKDSLSEIATGTVSGTSYDIKTLGNYSKAGVRVELFNTKNEVIKSILTDKNGDYCFKGIEAGEYTVKFTYLDKVISKSVKVAANSISDVDAGFAANTAYTPIQTIPTGTAHVSGTVFADKDADGVMDKGEMGNARIGVYAYDAKGKYLAYTATDANGHYAFSKLPAMTIKLKFIGPADSFVSLVNKKGETDLFTLSNGDKITDVNAGMAYLPSVKVFVFADKDGNGLRESSEGAATYKSFYLLDAKGKYHSSSYTDHKGNMTFSNVKPGTYTLKYVLNDGHEISSDASVAVSGDMSVSVGLIKYNILKGQVWSDKDGDAIWDANEKGRAGQVIQASKDGVVVATTTTDAKGNYVFDHLVDGTYKLLVKTLSSEVVSYQHDVTYKNTTTVKNIGIQDVLSNDHSLDSLLGAGSNGNGHGASSAAAHSNADAMKKLAKDLDGTA